MKTFPKLFSESRGAGLVASMRKRVARLNFCLVTILIGFSLSLGGCKTLQKIQAVTNAKVSEQTSDSLIVLAEKSTFIAKDTLDTFLSLEFQHREAYAKISPQIHIFAETLRADKDENGYPFGVDVLKSARVATKAYKANRTPENEANLRTAWKTLQKIIDDCRKYSALPLGP